MHLVGSALSADQELRTTKTGSYAENADTRNGKAAKVSSIAAQGKKPYARSDLWLRHNRIFFYVLTALLIISMIAVIPYLTYYGAITEEAFQYLESVLFSFLLTSVAMAYLLGKGMRIEEALTQLGFSRKNLLRNILIGLFIFAIILTFELIISLISSASGVEINTNVGMVLGGAPLAFLVFASIIGPINEEIFFRGFLTPRIGIFFSAVIFALLHASYDSSFAIEVIAAFVFGIIAGYAFKKTKSIYPSLVAHIIINTIAVLAFVVIL
jgi:membrane protease YdiL (CAAX protease family)